MISYLHGNDTLLLYPVVEILCHGIQSWALREGTEEKTRPVVMFLHDGPQQAFGKVYHSGMQLLAQNGYVVLSANLPGGTGCGKDFSVLSEHLGDDDCNGPIRFLDAALDAHPEINPSHLAVTGAGYGAYLTAAATRKHSHFGAAICDGVISSCASMMSTDDRSITFVKKRVKTCTFKQTGELWERPPLSHAVSMRTPTLLLHDENNRSSHLSQGQMLFTALKIHGVPARLCIFPGENHNLAGKGTPLTHNHCHTGILRWLKTYLQKNIQTTPGRLSPN